MPSNVLNARKVYKKKDGYVNELMHSYTTSFNDRKNTNEKIFFAVYRPLENVTMQDQKFSTPLIELIFIESCFFRLIVVMEQLLHCKVWTLESTV